MCCDGLLPRLDCAVFADVGWEPDEVYASLAYLKKAGKDAGIPVVTVQHGNLREDAMVSVVGGLKTEGLRWAAMPIHTVDSSGKKGMIRRQCTNEYKIQPVSKYIRREMLGLAKGQRAPIGAVNLWFGISGDEMRRVRISTDRWKTHIYPLVGLPDRMLAKNYNREGCVKWLNDNHPEMKPHRSSCIGCPFHSQAEWREIMANPKYRGRYRGGRSDPQL